MGELDLKEEIDRLKAECNHLKEQRDSYRKELDEQSHKAESLLSAQLKLLSVSLAKDIRGEMFESAKRWTWIFAIAIGIATIGGYMNLRDTIKDRINAKIEEKNSDIRKLLDEVITSVVDFKTKSKGALNEIDQQRKKFADETSKLHNDISQVMYEFKYKTDIAVDEVNKRKDEVIRIHEILILGVRNQSLDIHPEGPTGSTRARSPNQ